MKKILKHINFFFVSLIVLVVALFVAEKSNDVSVYDAQFTDTVYADVPAVPTGDGSDGGDGI